MAFSEADKNVITFLRQTKKYGAKRFLREFPNRGWTLGLLNTLILKIDRTGSTQRQPGSGRPKPARTVTNIELVESLVLSQEDRPQTHRTQRQISREINLSRSSVRRIIKADLHLKCLKKRRAQELTAANKQARLERSRRLLRLYPANVVNFIWFTDEKLFTVATVKTIVSMFRRLRIRKTYQQTVCCALILRSASPSWCQSVSLD